MKKLQSLLLIGALTLGTVNTNAASFIKQNNTEVVANTNANTSLTVETTTATETSATATAENAATQKGGAKLDKIVYILLAFFGLGWLAMGINDNFQGTDWIISLVLYLLLWLPGFIYTLIKMNKYY